jgi:NDP-sugar pyrophosphorylase family protein
VVTEQALKHLPPSQTPTNTPAGVFISPDSFLHPSVYGNLGEKVGIKRCVIGRGCVIGKGSKLTNCVLMEGVVLGDKYVDHSLDVSSLPTFTNVAVSLSAASNWTTVCCRTEFR